MQRGNFARCLRFIPGIQAASRRAWRSALESMNASQRVLLMSPHRPEILIIEKQRESVAELLRFLHGKAVDVMVALNVSDGFRKACEGQPDLIVLNTDLPEGAGMAVLQRLGNEIATAHMPVLVVSEKRAARNKREAYGAGAVDYLAKPLREKPLMARIFVHFKLPLVVPAPQPAPPTALPSFFEVSSSHTSQVVMETIALLQEKQLAWPGTVVLARQLGVAEEDLEQAFTQQFGLTVEVFHGRQRLEWARAQLRSTQQTVARIAHAVGCRNASDFGLLFRKHYGLLPEDYRRLH